MKEIRVIVVRDRSAKSAPTPIQGPKDVYTLLARRARKLDREHFWVVHLDARNALLSLETISVGTLTASLVHPREALKSAILVGAAAVVLVHNHPSDSSEPSPEDIQTTKRLARAGHILGIPVVDHLILDGRGSYVSLKERMPGIFTGADRP